MNNYQIITARLQPPVPLPTETVASSNNTINSTVTNDGPSTSAAAVAALAESQSNASGVGKVASIATPKILTESSIHRRLQNHDNVTIEDIGGEEHEYGVTQSGNAAPVSASVSVHTPGIEICTNDKTTSITAEQPENAELSELRKRRLKFLEDISKLSTPTKITSENTSSD